MGKGLGGEEAFAPNGSELRDSALRNEGPRPDDLLLLSAALLINSW